MSHVILDSLLYNIVHMNESEAIRPLAVPEFKTFYNDHKLSEAQLEESLSFITRRQPRLLYKVVRNEYFNDVYIVQVKKIIMFLSIGGFGNSKSSG